MAASRRGRRCPAVSLAPIAPRNAIADASMAPGRAALGRASPGPAARGSPDRDPPAHLEARGGLRTLAHSTHQASTDRALRVARPATDSEAGHLARGGGTMAPGRLATALRATRVDRGAPIGRRIDGRRIGRRINGRPIDNDGNRTDPRVDARGRRSDRVTGGRTHRGGTGGFRHRPPRAGRVGRHRPAVPTRRVDGDHPSHAALNGGRRRPTSPSTLAAADPSPNRRSRISAPC